MSEAAKVDLVGVGLNATDTLIAVPRHPERGSKVESLEVSVLPGGQVASAVIACQSWGLQTRYVGKLGDDPAATLAVLHQAPAIFGAYGMASAWAGDSFVTWTRHDGLPCIRDRIIATDPEREVFADRHSVALPRSQARVDCERPRIACRWVRHCRGQDCGRLGP